MAQNVTGHALGPSAGRLVLGPRPLFRIETSVLRSIWQWATACILVASALLSGSRGLAADAPGTAEVRETRFVSAPLDPSRGTFLLEAGYGYRSTSSTFGSDGLPVPSDPTTRWTVQVLEVGSAFGITDRTTIRVRFPILFPTLRQEEGGNTITNPGPAPGDTWIEAHWRIKKRRRPFGEWLLLVTGLAPTGVDAPGAPGAALATGTGIPEIGAGLLWRRQLGPAAASLSADYALGISQVVPYVSARYDDGTTGPARLYPGNVLRARAALQIEPAPVVWAALDILVERRGSYRVGTTSDGLFPMLDLAPVEDSDRLDAETGFELAVPVNDTVTLHLFGRYRFYGKTLPEFASLGIEAYSLPPGFFAGAKVVFHL